jgi:hypothetical protein
MSNYEVNPSYMDHDIQDTYEQWEHATLQSFDFVDKVANQTAAEKPHRCESEVLSAIIGVAYLCAATADIANAVNDGVIEQSRYNQLELYLPTCDENFFLAHQDLIEHANSCGISNDLLTLGERIRFGIRAGNMLIRDNFDDRVPPSAFSDSWSHICQGMLAAIEICISQGLQSGNKYKDLEQPRLLLEQVCAGKRPCFDKSLNVSVPSWAERRAAPRIDCEVSAWIRGEEVLEPVIIQDISRTGLGLKEYSGEALSGRIEIVINSHRTLFGTVVWYQNGAAGVNLETALDRDDELLSGANL